MLSHELEFTLNQAFRQAREKRQEFMTVEHLLQMLLDSPSAASVLRACGGDIDRLRRELGAFIDKNTPLLPEGDERDVQPTIGFQRVLQRSMFHVQASGKREVTGANVLVAIFSEKESHAVFLLGKQGISRLDVVNYIAHGISKVNEGEENESPASPEDDSPGRGGRQVGAGQVRGQPERAGASGPYRPADRPCRRDRADHEDPVPAAQEQPAVRG